MPTKFDVVDAARLLAQLLKQSSDETLDQAYTLLASDANNSKYAATLEPLQYMLSAIGAESRRRLFHAANNEDGE